MAVHNWGLQCRAERAGAGGRMVGLVQPQAEEMLLPSRLQLWVLGESPHVGTAWGAAEGCGVTATCSCSKAPVEMGEGAPGSCGDSGGHFSCGTRSLGVTNQRMFTWRRHLSKCSICAQLYCCSPQTNPFQVSRAAVFSAQATPLSWSCPRA